MSETQKTVINWKIRQKQENAAAEEKSATPEDRKWKEGMEKAIKNGQNNTGQ